MRPGKCGELWKTIHLGRTSAYDERGGVKYNTSSPLHEFNFLEEVDMSVPSKQLQGLVVQLNRYLKNKDFDSLANLMLEYKPEYSDIEEVNIILRTTFTVRSEFSDMWMKYRNAAFKHFRRQYSDKELAQIFYGLNT